MRSIYSKIIIPTSTLIIVALTLIIIFSVININVFIAPDIKRLTKDLIYSKSNEISYWLDMRLNEMTQLADNITIDEVDKESAEKYIKYLRNYEITNSENYESFGIISKDGLKYLTSGNVITVDTRQYFQNIKETNKDYIITDPIISKANETEIILIVVKIKNEVDEVVGYLSGAVSIEYLNQIINRANIYNFPMELYNKNTNQILVSNIDDNNNVMKKSNFTEFESDIDQESNWKLKMMVPDSFINRKIKETSIFTIIVSISILGFTIFILRKYVKAIVKPIEELKAKMNFTEIKNLNTIEPDKKIIELNSLGSSYNDMVKNIQRLVDELEKKEKLKKEAEYKALYSQIKPHFLYNTLETIQAMAISEDNEEIENAIGNLATLFRIGLSGDKSFIKLEDELRHLHSYVEIQLLRYGKKFTYEIDCNGINKNSKFMKFTLQPLIENAIYHGVKLMENVGYIKVNISYDKDDYIIKIINSSDYIDIARIEEVNNFLSYGDKEESGDGYGLYNVNERLKLNFGEDYGVRLEMVGNDVVAIVKHPVMKGEEDV